MPCPVGWLCRNWLEHSKIKQTPKKCPFLRNSISSQQFKISVKLTISLHKSYQINKKWLDKYILHCGFAQNELDIWNKSLWLSVGFSNNFLSASGKLRLFYMKYYPRHLVTILGWPPKPPSQAEMDDCPAWEDSGESLPQDGNGKRAW